MSEIANALGGMVPLVIVTGLGYVAARAGFLSSEIRPKLSGLIFNITLPCSILASVGEVDASTGSQAITWSLILAFALFFVMLLAGGVANAVLHTPRDERSVYLWMGMLTNTGFIGFAVLQSIFGGASVFLGSIFIAVSNVFLYSIGVAILRSGGAAGREGASRRHALDIRDGIKDMMNVPLVVSIVAMVVFFVDVEVPAPIMQAASMAGGATSPLAMMLVGLSIADADLHTVLGSWRLWGFALVRFLIAPLAAYAMLAPAVPNALALGVFVVMFAMPTGSMAGPIAATYGCDGELPSRGTIVSTLASFVIIPILVYVMGASI